MRNMISAFIKHSSTLSTASTNNDRAIVGATSFHKGDSSRRIHELLKYSIYLHMRASRAKKGISLVSARKHISHFPSMRSGIFPAKYTILAIRKTNPPPKSTLRCRRSRSTQFALIVVVVVDCDGSAGERLPSPRLDPFQNVESLCGRSTARRIYASSLSSSRILCRSAYLDSSFSIPVACACACSNVVQWSRVPSSRINLVHFGAHS